MKNNKIPQEEKRKDKWYYIIYSTGEKAGRVPDNNYLWKGGSNWVRGIFTRKEAEDIIKRTNEYRVSNGWKEEVFYILEKGVTSND